MATVPIYQTIRLSPFGLFRTIGAGDDFSKYLRATRSITQAENQSRTKHVRLAISSPQSERSLATVTKEMAKRCYLSSLSALVFKDHDMMSTPFDDENGILIGTFEEGLSAGESLLHYKIAGE